MSENLLTLVDKWKNSDLELREAERLITLLIVDNERTDREAEQLIQERDHWEEKATELANYVGAALGFEVGEHSNINCPVQEAIDGVYRMRAQIEEWRNSPPANYAWVNGSFWGTMTKKFAAMIRRLN